MSGCQTLETGSSRIIVEEQGPPSAQVRSYCHVAEQLSQFFCSKRSWVFLVPCSWNETQPSSRYFRNVLCAESSYDGVVG